jgi:hypothetical protein
MEIKIHRLRRLEEGQVTIGYQLVDAGLWCTALLLTFKSV